jgi:uncharacterized protein with HEPN domain
MVHHLVIIGEAARAIDPAFQKQYPSVPWRLMAGMRNVIVHDYFRINNNIVWKTVSEDLPMLREEIEKISS